MQFLKFLSTSSFALASASENPISSSTVEIKMKDAQSLDDAWGTLGVCMNKPTNILEKTQPESWTKDWLQNEPCACF